MATAGRRGGGGLVFRCCASGQNKGWRVKDKGIKRGRLRARCPALLFGGDEGDEVAAGEDFEEGEDGDFGFAEIDAVVGGELADEGFDGGFAVEMVPGPGAQVVEIETLFGESGGAEGEEFAEGVGLEGGGEAEAGGVGGGADEGVGKGDGGEEEGAFGGRRGFF